MIALNEPLTELQGKALPSSVHTTETTTRDIAFRTYGELLRENWPNEWPATLDAYQQWDDRHGTSHAFDLKHCRSFATFNRNINTGQVRVFGSSCRLRWCPLCGQSHSMFLAEQVKRWYSRSKKQKLLTLTLRSSDSPLGTQINRLFTAFRNLRNQRWFASKIVGGIWFFQVTYNTKTDQWHPHLHALLAGNFLPYQELQARWLHVTGDSDVIDIRRCWSPDSAAAHVARYATRPGTLASVPSQNKLDLMEALKGRRICGSWGSARVVRLHRERSDDRDQWVSLGTWEAVTSAVHFSDAARAIALAWRDQLCLAEGISMVETIELTAESFEDGLRDIDKYYNTTLYDP